MTSGYFIIILIAICDSKILRWVHDSKWSNPANWNLNRVPCSKDIIVLPSPESTPTVIFLQQNVSITEMNLPFNGELLFFDNSGISATQTNNVDHMCAVGGEIRYKSRDRGWWLDESNWCETSRVEGVDCLERPRFRLDTERVPCKSDEVVFTKFSSFLVQVEANLALNVGVLKMFSRYHNTPSFISLVKKSDLSDLFFWPTTTVINIAGQTCNDPSDCECGNNVGKIKEYICRRKTCPDTFPCTNWFTPEGHCCPVCGVMLTSSIDLSCYSARVFYYKIQDLLEQISVNHMNYVNVSVSKISSNKVQVVLIDGSVDGIGIRMGHELRRLLEKVINDKKQICINTINLVSSRSNSTSSIDAQTGEEAKNRLGLGLGLFFIIVIIIVVVVVVFNVRHRIKGQYIPQIRDRLSRVVPSYGDQREQSRSVIFDNSFIFDSSMSSISDPTFFGGHRSEASQMEMTEPRARLMDYDALTASRESNVGGGGGILQEAGRRIRASIGSISPRAILSNLERRVSGESSDFFHKKMKEESPTEQEGTRSEHSTPTSKKKKSKLETADSNQAFENPYFDEKKLKVKDTPQS